MNKMQVCLQLSAIIAVLSLLNACSDSSSLKWTEDVSLPDGRVVTLTRYQEFAGPHELTQSPTESDYWLEFRNPDNDSVVRWAHDRNLATVALLIENGIPYLVMEPGFGSSRWKYSCPNPPYLVFEYINNQWTSRPLSELPVQRFRSNVTRSAYGRRSEIERSGSHLSVSQTQASFLSSSAGGSLRNYPWIVDLGHFKGQTFEVKNCQREPDYLLDASATDRDVR